jgi:hypothetical protein
MLLDDPYLRARAGNSTELLLLLLLLDATQISPSPAQPACAHDAPVPALEEVPILALPAPALALEEPGLPGPAVVVPRIMRAPVAPLGVTHCCCRCSQVCEHVLVKALVLTNSGETPPVNTQRNDGWCETWAWGGVSKHKVAAP